MASNRIVNGKLYVALDIGGKPKTAADVLVFDKDGKPIGRNDGILRAKKMIDHFNKLYKST